MFMTHQVVGVVVFLDAMSSQRNLHYIGTDPNPDTTGRYEIVANYYNNKCFEPNPFWGNPNLTHLNYLPMVVKRLETIQVSKSMRVS